jgi:hypothetical protein
MKVKGKGRKDGKKERMTVKGKRKEGKIKG